ncbi:MAG: glycoside hydrolase family 95 protein, partial [Flammeovirgaceae bacterium]|nr:glycoside hydrolase family 95 protein [Flammeovirgaceae bacterium]
MKPLVLISVLFCPLFQVSCNDSSNPEKALNPSLVLWYDKPAVKWTEALPVGNGRLGAMVYGGTEKEIVQFNEETLWTGQPHNYANSGAFQALSEIRQLLWEGKQVEAQTLGNKEFMSLPLGQFNYQPFGNLLLDFPGHKKTTNYKRKLDLENGITSINYEIGELKFKREVFASAPDQAVVTYMEAS